MKSPTPALEQMTYVEAVAALANQLLTGIKRRSEERQNYEESLTPEQRSERAKKQANDRLQREFTSFCTVLGPYVKALGTRESWGTQDFSALLVGVRPDAADDLFLSAAVLRNCDEIHKTLESCVGVMLHAIPGCPSGNGALFRTGHLLSVAKIKQLGKPLFVEAIVRTGHLGVLPIGDDVRIAQEPSAKAPLSASDLPRIGTSVRMDHSRKRRDALQALAGELIAEQKGQLEPEDAPQRVVLWINTYEFIALFVKRHPEYASTTARTLLSDRSRCTPPIEFRKGRRAGETKDPRSLIDPVRR